MRIGVLGTGVVGRTIGSKLVQLGHEVTMGSRSADNESATGWVSDAGENGRALPYAQIRELRGSAACDEADDGFAGHRMVEHAGVDH